MELLFWTGLSVSLLMLFSVTRLWWIERGPGVAILLYHRVRSAEGYESLTGAERNFSVRRDRFREQLDWLKRTKHTFVTVDELAAILAGAQPAPARGVCITFDDGSESVLTHAQPTLESYQVPGAVFVTTDPSSWVFEDQPRLSADQLRQLHRAGFAVGSHGTSHHGFDQMEAAGLERELMESRATLEGILDEPIRDIAIPVNFYTPQVLATCRESGYRMVFTATPGRARAGDDPSEVRRIAVEGQMTLREFVRSLSPRVLVQRRIVSALKRIPPTLLGEKRWMPLRKRLFESRLGRCFTFRYLRIALLIGAVAWLAILAVLGALVL